MNVLKLERRLFSISTFDQHSVKDLKITTLPTSQSGFLCDIWDLRSMKFLNKHYNFGLKYIFAFKLSTSAMYEILWCLIKERLNLSFFAQFKKPESSLQ